jgi:hypothetical protein
MDTASKPSAAHPQTDRFLIGILIGVVVLLAVAGLSLLVLRQPPRELPADSPSGTIQRFFSALEQRNYNQAYDLLSDHMERKPTRDAFTRYIADQFTYGAQTQRVRIDTEQIDGKTATVTVRVTSYYGGGLPLGGANEYTSTETFTLAQEAGIWRITTLAPRYQAPF